MTLQCCVCPSPGFPAASAPHGSREWLIAGWSSTGLCKVGFSTASEPGRQPQLLSLSLSSQWFYIFDPSSTVSSLNEILNGSTNRDSRVNEGVGLNVRRRWSVTRSCLETVLHLNLAPIPPSHPTLLCHRDHRADQGNKDREQSERKSWNIELKVQGCWIIFATTDILAKLWQSEPFSRGCTYKDIGSSKRSRINLTTLIKVLVVVRLTLDTLSISFETSWFANSPG